MSQNLRAAHRDGVQLACAPGFQRPQGRGHGRAAGSAGSWGALQGCSAGMPWHAGAACSTGVPQLGLPGRDDAQLAQVVLPKQTLTSQEMASHHLRALPGLLCACWYKVELKMFVYLFMFKERHEHTQKSSPGIKYFSSCAFHRSLMCRVWGSVC